MAQTHTTTDTQPRSPEEIIRKKSPIVESLEPFRPIVLRLCEEEHLSNEKIEHNLRRIYGVITSSTQLYNRRTRKWGIKPNGQAQRSGEQRDNNAGLSYYGRTLNTAKSPSPFQTGLHQNNIWKREQMVYERVNSYIGCYFTANGAAARAFDLLYSTPGEDYQISWQKLSQISSKLPSRVEPGSDEKFSQTWDQIIDGVRAAIRETGGANPLIFFWRICRQVLDMQQKVSARRWFPKKDPIKILFKTILEETKNDQNGLPRLFNQLIEVVYEAPPDEVARLLERGYFQAIQRLRECWDRQTFTIPQMETDYLVKWQMTPSLYPALISEYEKLILHALDNLEADNERVFIFRHQFLFFLERCQYNPRIIHYTAKTLYNNARSVLEKRLKIWRGFPWDAVSNSFQFAARTLTTVHSQTLLADVPDDVRKNAIDKAFAYPSAAYNMLLCGDEECQRQASLLQRDLGVESYNTEL